MTWHTTTRIAENLYRISEPFGAIEPRVGVTTANMYLVIGQERAALINSAMGIGDVRAGILKITSLPCTVLNTMPCDDLIVGREFRLGVLSLWLPQ